VARHAWTAPFRPSKLAKQQGCFLDEDWTNGRYVTHDVICSKNRTGSTTLNNTYAQYAASRHAPVRARNKRVCDQVRHRPKAPACLEHAPPRGSHGAINDRRRFQLHQACGMR